MKRNMVLFTLTALLCVVLMSCSKPQQSLQITNTGEQGAVSIRKEEQALDVRWDVGYIVAEGKAVAPSNAESEAQGKLMAREGAILNARQRLIEEIQGIHVDGVTTMVNLMANSTVRGRISGFVQNAHVVPDSESWEDGIYSVEVRVPKTNIASVAYSTRQAEFSMQSASSHTGSGYSGLVIDARGVNVTESLIFNVLTDTGVLIYGPSSVSFSIVQSNTMATYVTSLEIARRDSRVTSNPVIIKSIGSRGVDIIISQTDGSVIQQALQLYDFLNAGRVVVIVD